MENSQEHSVIPLAIPSHEKHGIFTVDQETRIKDFSLAILKNAPALSLLDFCERFSQGRKEYFTGKTSEVAVQLQQEIRHIRGRRDLTTSQQEDMFFNLLKKQSQPIVCAFIEGVLSNFEDDPLEIGKQSWTINDLAYFMVYESIHAPRGDYEHVMTQGSALQRIFVYAFLYENPEKLSHTISELSKLTRFFGSMVYSKDTHTHLRRLDEILFRIVRGAATCALGLRRAEGHIGSPNTRVSPAPIDFWDFQYGIDGVVWDRQQNTIVGLLASGTDKIPIQQNQENRKYEVIEHKDFYSSRLSIFPAFESFTHMEKGEKVGAGLKRQRDFERFLHGAHTFALESKRLLDPAAQLFFWLSHFPQSVIAFNQKSLTSAQFARQAAEVVQKA